MKKIWIVSAMVCLLAVACGTAEKRGASGRPAWLSGASERYPAALYLVGRGSAVKLDLAKDRARADVAKTFHTAVREKTRDVQHFQGNSSGAKQLEQKVTRALETHTEAVMRGMEIGDVWREPESGDYYALAVLSRPRAARRLRDRIEDLDETTARTLQAAGEATDPLRHIAWTAKAVEAQRERAGLQNMLQVIDASGRGMPPRWNVPRLETELDTMLEGVRIAPRAPAGLMASLSGALSAGGFTVVRTRPDYFLDAVLEIHDIGRRMGWYWLRGILRIKLVDPDGAVRGARQWPLKDSATDRASARSRIGEQAQGLLKKSLKDAIYSFVLADR